MLLKKVVNVLTIPLMPFAFIYGFITGFINTINTLKNDPNAVNE